MLTKDNRLWQFISHLFLSIDQLGNVLAGGNSDNTISARVGFYNHHDYTASRFSRYWKFLEWIIDTAFEPVDGKAHCHEAYHNDAGEIFNSEVIELFVIIAGLLIILTCIPIAVILYTLSAFKIVKQKVIQREENLTKRLDYCNLQLKSLLQEIKEHPIKDLDTSEAKRSFVRMKGRISYLEKVLETGEIEDHLQ